MPRCGYLCMKRLCLLAVLGLSACAAGPDYYAAETPKMDFITYFSGTTHGYGAIYDFRGRQSDRFYVKVEGTAGKDSRGRRTLEMAEDFTYTSGKTQKRSWSVVEIAPGQLEGKAADVPGLAKGTESGSALQFRYPITITRDNGKTITLSSNDWMWMMPHNTVQNRNTLSKFGVPVAELVMSFTKTAP